MYDSGNVNQCLFRGLQYAMGIWGGILNQDAPLYCMKMGKILQCDNVLNISGMKYGLLKNEGELPACP